MDCLVHAADREPFGRVVIEAMAWGIPVIAVETGGPAELVANGRTGVLVPPGDVRRLAQAMVDMAENVDAARQMGANARSMALRKYNIADTVAGVDALYAKVLSGGK